MIFPEGPHRHSNPYSQVDGRGFTPLDHMFAHKRGEQVGPLSERSFHLHRDTTMSRVDVIKLLKSLGWLREGFDVASVRYENVINGMHGYHVEVKRPSEFVEPQKKESVDSYTQAKNEASLWYGF